MAIKNLTLRETAQRDGIALVDIVNQIGSGVYNVNFGPDGIRIPYFIDNELSDVPEVSPLKTMEEVEERVFTSLDSEMDSDLDSEILLDESDVPMSTGLVEQKSSIMTARETNTLVEDGKACAIYLLHEMLEQKNYDSKETVTSIHSIFDCFNKTFAKMFPYLNPISLTELMANEELIDIKRVSCGVRMTINYGDKVSELLQREPSELVLGKLEKEVGRYDYSTKKEWRQKWFDAIQKEVGINEDTTLLTLGGFGDEIEGYKKLDVPLENIVVVESNWLRAGYIKKKYPKVQVYRGFLKNYLMKTEQGFDGVLLDFDGSLSEKSIALLPLVAPLLKHRAIYGINVLGVRDVKETYLDCFVKPKSNGWLDNMGMPKEEFIDKNRLGVLRDKGITAVMLRAINNSQLNENFSSLYRALPKGRRPSSEILGDVLLQGPAQQLKHRLDLIDNLADYLKTKTISPYFALLRGVFSTDPLIPEKIERNIYEAVGGYNYFSDFVVVKQFVGDIENLLENYVPAKFRKYIYGSMTTDNLIRYYDTLSSRDKYNLNSKIEQAGKYVLREYSGLFLPQSFPSRTKIIFDQSKVTSEIKSDVIKMIKSGKSNQQILGVHPEVRRNLGAIKAHVTMGSYD